MLMVTWDCPKVGVLGKWNSLLDTQFWNNEVDFGAKTINFIFDIPYIYSVIWFHFNRTWKKIDVFFIEIFNKQGNYKLL